MLCFSAGVVCLIAVGSSGDVDVLMEDVFMKDVVTKDVLC